jgi:hypothetical protein
MKTFIHALAILLVAVPVAASAAGGKIKTGAMQVTFTVIESCSVNSGDNAQAVNSERSAAPKVSCELNTPYQVSSSASKAVAPANRATDATIRSDAAIRTEAAPQDWTIYF